MNNSCTVGKRKGVWLVKVGKREHPEHILNRFFETFIIYSTGRRLQSNEGGQNDKKKKQQQICTFPFLRGYHPCLFLSSCREDKNPFEI